MKIKILLFTAVAGISYLTLSSNDSGPAANSNGNLTSSTCGGGGCHGSNDANTTITLTLVETATGAQVTNGKYKPQTLYTVTLAGSNTSVVGAPTPKAGFQLVANTSSNTQAGSFQASGNEHVINVSGIQVVEHSTPKAFSGGTFAFNTFSWTSPLVGSGAVTFKSIVNATNGNGNADNADHATTKTFTFTELSASVAQLSKDILINAYPNPATDNVNFKFENAETGNYTITIIDYTGRKVYSDNILMNSNSQNITVNTSNWASGLYFAQISKDGAVRMIPISKK